MHISWNQGIDKLKLCLSRSCQSFADYSFSPASSSPYVSWNLHSEFVSVELDVDTTLQKLLSYFDRPSSLYPSWSGKLIHNGWATQSCLHFHRIPKTRMERTWVWCGRNSSVFGTRSMFPPRGPSCKFLEIWRTNSLIRRRCEVPERKNLTFFSFHFSVSFHFDLRFLFDFKSLMITLC